MSGSAHRPAPGPPRPPRRPSAVPGRHQRNKVTPTSPVAAFSFLVGFLAGHQPLPAFLPAVGREKAPRWVFVGLLITRLVFLGRS